MYCGKWHGSLADRTCDPGRYQCYQLESARRVTDTCIRSTTALTPFSLEGVSRRLGLYKELGHLRVKVTQT